MTGTAGPAMHRGGDDIRLDDRVTELIERGLERYGAGDLEGALSEWNHALVLDPDNRRVADYVSYIEKHFELDGGSGPRLRGVASTPDELAPFPLEDVGPLQDVGPLADDDVDAYESIEISTGADDSSEWSETDWERTGGGPMRTAGADASRAPPRAPEGAPPRRAVGAPLEAAAFAAAPHPAEERSQRQPKRDPEPASTPTSSASTLARAEAVDDGWDLDAGWDMDELAGTPEDSPFAAGAESGRAGAGTDAEVSFADLIDEAPPPGSDESSFAGLIDEPSDPGQEPGPFDDRDETIDRPPGPRRPWRAPAPQAASGRSAFADDSTGAGTGPGDDGTGPGELTGEMTTPGGEGEVIDGPRLASEVVASLDTVADGSMEGALADTVEVDDGSLESSELEGPGRLDDQSYEKTIERSTASPSTMRDTPPLAALDLDDEQTMDRGALTPGTSRKRRAPTTDPGLSTVPVKVDESLLSFEDATHELDISKFDPPSSASDADQDTGTREFAFQTGAPGLTVPEELIGRGALSEDTIDDYRQQLESELGRGDSKERILKLIERAEADRAEGRTVAAVVAAELAFDEDPTSAGAQKMLHDHQERLSQVYTDLVGELDRCPRLARPLHDIPLGELDHRSAFLLSRIDGSLSFEDILDISGMTRFEAVRTLGRLMLHGYLEVE